MGRSRARMAGLFLAAGALACTPAFAVPAAPIAPVAAVADGKSDWSATIWDAARRGDQKAVNDLLARLPEGIDPDSRLAQSIALLKSNFEAREKMRAEETRRATVELNRALAEREMGDLAISQALRSAVALQAAATDKEAFFADPKIRNLIRDAEAAARGAAERGDWLSASELYFRLGVLDDESGKYKDDLRRETQRLAMIRLYNPQRLWELRNDRRNAEIAWQEKFGEDEPVADGSDDAAARERQRRPLPRYNPVGDDFKQKIEDIDEDMIRGSISRAYARHVEKMPMADILLSGIDAVRTLVTTEDLKPVFTGVANEQARAEFLKELDREAEKLSRPNFDAGTPELQALLIRLPGINERTVKLPRQALLHEFGNGAMGALDEYSGIIWPDEIRRFNRNTQAQFKGVGIQIELDPMSNIRVVTPLEGTPAQRAGVRPGDLIKKVNGESTEGFTLDQAVDVITGPENTRVVLTLEREVVNDDGQKKVVELDFPLVRKTIPIYTVKGWRKSGPREDDWDWFVDPTAGIGYVRLTGFAEKTDAEFDRAVDQMKAQGLRAVILDLRFNPGGLLDQAVAITSRFVDRAGAAPFSGLVVTTHAKDNRISQREAVLSNAASLKNIPVVVLINEGSASASEIVSGAIQDYASAGSVKALLLGARTYGKGSVQNVWQLNGAAEAAVKVTTQYYHLPGGRMIHRLPDSKRWGVDPNLLVEMLLKQTSDSLQLRQNADVSKIDENGRLIVTNEPPANPDDLIAKGLDLQLHQALVLLQSQVASTGAQAMIEKPVKTN